MVEIMGDRHSLPPYLNSDPAHKGFQYLEDIATGYWYSEVLFSAVELDLFGHIEAGAATPAALAGAADCKMPGLMRLITALVKMDLIHATPQGFANSQIARRFLVPDQKDYMGDFILYRHYMMAGWSGLTRALTRTERSYETKIEAVDDDYTRRNFHYVRAMDRLARLKAREIVSILNTQGLQGPLLDVGGGGGALARELIASQAAEGRKTAATLFDLPEVIDAARRLYPKTSHWLNLGVIAGDFRHHRFSKGTAYGLVVLSNFMHAYGAKTAHRLIVKAAGLTTENGILLIHDYFPDRPGIRPHKGALYDLNMLLNTYDGACHEVEIVRDWLTAAGMKHTLVADLASDSTIILAGRSGSVADLLSTDRRERAALEIWPEKARALGFSRAELVETDRIVTASWVRMKCRFGCAGYDKNHMCPPDGIDHAAMAKMLEEYDWSLLVVATPPGREFHQRLLDLEREAFLAGLPKALAFGAGPCPVCPVCTEEGACRHPEKARPSMEGSGIDVYGTARQAGIRLDPVKEKGQYVKYMGMVLLE